MCCPSGFATCSSPASCNWWSTSRSPSLSTTSPTAAALQPVLIELGRWGSRQQLTSRNDLSVSAMMCACVAMFDSSRAADGIYGFRVGGESATITIVRERIDVRRGLDNSADVILDTNVHTLRHQLWP